MTNSNADFLYTKDGNVEFWTRRSDGESAVSIRGLARMCGKTLSTVQNCLNAIENFLTDEKGFKRLKPFEGKDIYLTDEILINYSQCGENTS